MKVELGKMYTDKVTGFTGVCTAHCEYLHGSAQTRLEAMIHGKAEVQWFETARLEIVG